MNEIIFTYDMNVEKFKTFVSKNFNEKQLYDIIDTLYMYIEIISNEEMNNRIHAGKRDDTVEQKLIWVAELASTFKKFLKNSWQK